MADVLIRGMEMPRRREEVFLFAVDSDGKVYGWDSEELPRLKAIAIPDHGRLIDADALMRVFEREQKAMYDHGREFSCSFLSNGQEISTEWCCVEDMLENAETVIPASEVENG